MGKSKQLATMLTDAPAALDTLDELAAALGDDANFATTVTNSIATKANSADVYTKTETDTSLLTKLDVSNPAIDMGTNKKIRFTGGIGEIGSVPGFQATNDANDGLRSMGLRGTTLRFATGDDERLRIEDNAVGIGTESPSTTDSGYNKGALHVHNATGSGSQVRWTNSTTGTGTSDGFMISKWSDKNTYITNFDDGANTVFTQSNSSGTLVTTMTIDGDGNVGIGSVPESTVKLEVNAGADGAVAISGRSDGGNGNNRRFNLIPYADGGGANYGGGLKIQTRDSVNVFHDRITVQSNGNVGIGTASPATRLQVAGTQNTPSSTSKGMLLVRADGSSHGLQMGVMGTSPWGSWIQAQDNDIATAYPLTLQPGGGIVHVPDTSRLIVGNTLGDAVNVNANYKNSLQQYTRMATSTSVNHPCSASSTKHYLYDRATVGDKVNIPLTVFFPNGISNLAIRLYYNDYSLWISGEAITGSTYNNAQATGFRRYSFSHNYNGTTNYENVLTNTENVGLNSSHFELNHHGYDANESGGAHYWEFRHIQSTGNALHVQFQMHGSGVSYATGTWYFKCTTY